MIYSYLYTMRFFQEARFPGSEKEGQGRSSPGPGPPLPYERLERTIRPPTKPSAQQKSVEISFKSCQEH